MPIVKKDIKSTFHLKVMGKEEQPKPNLRGKKIIKSTAEMNEGENRKKRNLKLSL